MLLFTTQTRAQWLARLVAGILILAGIYWFVANSPKTPVEFFDAACKDQSALEDLGTTTPTEILSTLSTHATEMARLALIYDITHDPQRVQKERSSILLGFYQPSSSTEEALTRNSGRYRELKLQVEELHRERKASRMQGDLSPRTSTNTEENEAHRRKLIQQQLSRMILRQFQAKFFWIPQQ